MRVWILFSGMKESREIPTKAGYLWRRGYHPVSEISGAKYLAGSASF